MRVVPVALVALAACTQAPPTSPPRQVADWFVDKHYVEMDPESAARVATGVAADALAKELALVAAVRGGGYGPKQAKHRVFWEHTSAASDESVTQHTYRLRIDAGAIVLHKEVVVALTERDGAWRVVSYRDRDVPEPQ